MQKPLPAAEDVISDKRDLPALGVVAASDSVYLITGDKALLSLKKNGSTDIVSPRSFWETIKRNADN